MKRGREKKQSGLHHMLKLLIQIKVSYHKLEAAILFSTKMKPKEKKWARRKLVHRHRFSRVKEEN